MRVRLNQHRLLQALAHSRLSQNHWAIKLGLSRGHLSDLANGKHPYPSPKTREKLMEGLKLSFDELFDVGTESTEWSHASSASFQAAVADRYLIDEEIGQGGMGTVYLARDVKHGRRVAIKVVSPEVVSGVGSGQFLKEIRKTASLEHPHILTMLDSGEAAGYPYYVMPYIKGGSLRDLLEKRQQLSLDETLHVTRGVAAALRHAHDNHVVHCDIKPENILLAESHAYLADFGIARVVHAEVRTFKRRGEIDSSAGTPAYVSPEQASGEPNLDGKTDVYSLGCVVFEMLSGKKPFDGTTTLETVTKRFTSPIPDLKEAAPHLSGAVASAVGRAMAVDPAERFATAAEFSRALSDAAAQGHSVLRERLQHARRRCAASLAAFISIPRGTPIVSNVMQDLTYAIRSLKRRPAQTAVLVLTLALGIGVNSAMFSIVSAVLLRPLPYPDPDRLVAIWEADRDGAQEIAVAYPNFVDIRDQNERFAHVAAFIGGLIPVSGTEQPIQTQGYWVSEQFFDVLGVMPQLGGTFIPEESTAFGPTTLVLSDGFWRRQFGADSKILGRVLSISGRQATVVGVMPPGFAFPRGASLWMPQDLEPAFGPSRTAHNLRAVGRLNPGVEVQSAQVEMTGLAARLHLDYPDEVDESRQFRVVPLHADLAQEGGGTVILLFAVVAVVLVIACGNIASILLSQAVARNKEMAIRRALGAGSGRLVRQMLTETTFVGLIGAATGLILAFWSMNFLNALVPEGFLHSGGVRLGWRVAAFTMALGVFTGLLFGLFPALRLGRSQSQDALRADGAEVATGFKRLRVGGFFVVPQYAFSLSALIVAGLILKSLFALSQVYPGFDAQGLITVELSLPFAAPSPYGDRDNAVLFYRELVERASSLPGVRAVTLDLAPPLSSGFKLSGGVKREEDNPEERWTKFTDWRPVGANYFRTMGIPLLRGRDFDPSDSEEAPPVVIVNQSLARRLWGDNDPLGRRLRLSSLDNNAEEAARLMTVVGVAADIHQRGLDSEPRSAAYAPIFQHRDRVRAMDLVLAVSGPTEGYGRSLRELVGMIDPNVPIGRIETMDGWVRESITTPRFRAGLLAAFGALALLLALLGVYGVMSYSVSQRRREVAVRLALGADRRDILRMMTGEGVRFIVVGQIVGVSAAVALTRLVEGMLFGVSATDARVFGGVSLLLAAVVLLTCYMSARRAGRVEPHEVLRG